MCLRHSPLQRSYLKIKSNCLGIEPAPFTLSGRACLLPHYGEYIIYVFNKKTTPTPFFSSPLNQETEGVGSPVNVHVSSTRSPSCTVTSAGLDASQLIFGASKKNKKPIITRYRYSIVDESNNDVLFQSNYTLSSFKHRLSKTKLYD